MEPFAYLYLMQDYETPAQREPQGGLQVSVQPIALPSIKLSGRATIGVLTILGGLWSIALSEAAVATEEATYASYAGGGVFYVLEGTSDSNTASAPVSTSYPARPVCTNNCAPIPQPNYLPISPKCGNLGCGATGAEVRRLQILLSQIGYYQGPIDGVFGSATKQAVVRFQHNNHLIADGIVGPSTRRALGLVRG